MERRTKLALNVVYALAAIQFLRFYVTTTHLWVNLPRYLAGTDRLPYQQRYLPIPFILAFDKLLTYFPALNHGQGVLTPDKFGLFCFDTLAFAVAAFYLLRLYRAVSATRFFEPLVFPVFLVICLFTYAVQIGDTFSYPYDLSSVAFFTAGLFYIYERRFLPLLAVILIGTINRETTLFLIPLYLLDAASLNASAGTRLRDRLSFRHLSSETWLRAVILFVPWLAVDAFLTHHFAQNDHSEVYLRMRDNLGRLNPRLWPTVLNIGAYTLPILLLKRRNIQPTRFANYLLVLPAWVVVMFVKGTLTETRIYGEFTALFTISAVLLIESHTQAAARRLAVESVQSALDAQKSQNPAGSVAA